MTDQGGLLAETSVKGGKMDIIRVAAKSRSTSVAGAIAGLVRERSRAEVQAIGAGAVNQSVKAAAIARGYLALDGNVVVLAIPRGGRRGGIPGSQSA